MNWQYKTLLFGMKKESLLGGAYLDEVELEETLNQHGADGWELVSLVDVRDGLMAVLKKGLKPQLSRPAGSAAEQGEVKPELVTPAGQQPVIQRKNTVAHQPAATHGGNNGRDTAAAGEHPARESLDCNGELFAPQGGDPGRMRIG